MIELTFDLLLAAAAAIAVWVTLMDAGNN